jgi:hypothetical protein
MAERMKPGDLNHNFVRDGGHNDAGNLSDGDATLVLRVVFRDKIIKGTSGSDNITLLFFATLIDFESSFRE